MKFCYYCKELKLINEISKVGIRNLMYRDEIEVMSHDKCMEYQKLNFGLKVF